MKEIKDLTSIEITEAVKTKKISAHEVAKYFLTRTENLNPKLNAFITVNQNVLKDAEIIDEKIAKGESVGALAGVILGVKDMFCTKNLRTTAASKALENFIPPYTATAVSRLQSEGALILGKLNQDEFAMGSSSETSYFGAVKNPWNLNKTAGGSSGGSSAAQAARLVTLSLGTDTGGSVRQPASFCGVVGVKPTYGRVSRHGMIAYASSLDQAGVFSHTVRESAQMLQLMSGFDANDGTCSRHKVPDWTGAMNSDVKGKRIGIIKEHDLSLANNEVQKTFHRAVTELKKMGAEIVEIAHPLTKYSVPIYYLIASSEASSNLARYDGVRYGHRAEFKNFSGVSLEDFYERTRSESFGLEVKRRIMLGTYSLSSGYFDAYYTKAGQVRRLIRNELLEAFKLCDVILSPVALSPAQDLGVHHQDPLKTYLDDIFTTTANLAGLPALSVPQSLSAEGLPIGLQLMAAPFAEQNLFDVALAMEIFAEQKQERPHVI